MRLSTHLLRACREGTFVERFHREQHILAMPTPGTRRLPNNVVTSTPAAGCNLDSSARLNAEHRAGLEEIQRSTDSSMRNANNSMNARTTAASDWRDYAIGAAGGLSLRTAPGASSVLVCGAGCNQQR